MQNISKDTTTKILFTDLDGTLLNDEHEITGPNREAINKALCMGHKIVICTGRPLMSARILSDELGLTSPGCYSISYNGGVVYDCYNEKTIYETNISLPYVKYIFDEAEKWNLHCQTYSDEYILAQKDSQTLRTYESYTNIGVKIVPDVTDVLEKEPNKLIVIDYDDHDILVRFQAALAQWAHNKVDSIFSCDAYLEYIYPGVSKGNAIRFLCDYLHIPMENSISAGDAQNDISMFQTTHIAAAMYNARSEIKSHANYITERDNNNHGIAEIIDKFML